MKGNSFPKIFALGNRQVADILMNEVEITEKLDGSQFVFGRDENGDFFCRSKGADIDHTDLDSVQKLFYPAVIQANDVAHHIPNDCVFYAETLANPRHNTLKYNEVPKGNIALFGCSTYDAQEFVSYDKLCEWASILDVDVVPLLGKGHYTTNEILEFMNKPSVLGGVNAEGVVIKSYGKFDSFGKLVGVQSAKVVSEAFKEVHKKNPEFKSGKSNTIELFERYKTEARWNKAVQHLNEQGVLEHDPKDIGKLLKELNTDLIEECEDEIKDALWQIYRKEFLSTACRGFAEWYKHKLIKGD